MNDKKNRPETYVESDPVGSEDISELGSRSNEKLHFPIDKSPPGAARGQANLMPSLCEATEARERGPLGHNASYLAARLSNKYHVRERKPRTTTVEALPPRFAGGHTMCAKQCAAPLAHIASPR